MKASREESPLTCPTQAELDGLLRAGIDIMTLATPVGMRVATGIVGTDGRFEPDDRGDRWFAFEEPAADDIVFWHQRTGKLASSNGRAFALGQSVIGEAATYSFDCSLNIFADPMDWLRSRRDGVVVMPHHWPHAFDRLRDCPRIAIAASLLPAYKRYMRPPHLPELFVIPEHRRAA